MSSLPQGLAISEEYAVTRIKVAHHHRAIGIVEGFVM